MKLSSLLHRRTKTVPILPSEERPESARTTGRMKRSRPNGALEEQLERLLTPGELDLVQHHRI